MRPLTLLAAFWLLAGTALAAPQKHPHFDDRGTLPWHDRLDDARVAARKADKLVFIEYGRAACGNCRALAERVLPSTPVRNRIAELAVGLAADCDQPDRDVQELLREHLPEAKTLPFIAFITHDGKWVDGYAGHKDITGFLDVLARAEKTPLLDATPAVQKQLEKIAANATAAAEKGNWKGVLDAVAQAAKSNGRCAERTAIRDAEKQARQWANAQFETAIAEAQSGGDLAPIRKSLADVRRQFAGEPEAAEAEAGAKAVLRLTQIRDAEARPNPKRDLRETAAEKFAGSRWAAIFALAAGDKDDGQAPR